MKKHPQLIAVAALAFLTVGFVAPAHAFDLQRVDSPQAQAVSSKSSGISIDSHTIDGPTVQLAVTSTTSQSKTVVVQVLAVVAGQQVLSNTPVSLAPNGSAQVTVGFMGPVEGMISASILDNPNPI